MKRATTTKKSTQRHTIMIYSLGLLLFAPPFFRGLFFPKNWLTYELALIIFLGIFLFLNRNRSVAMDGMSWAALGLTGAYLIAVFAAYNKGGAYIEVLKLAGYFAVFYLCKNALEDLNDARKLLNFLYWSGVAASFISLGTAFGTFTYPGAFMDGRLYGTVQYPNTFASFLVCLVIPGVFLWITNNDLRLRLIYLAGNAVLWLGFFATVSRGGLLTLLAITIIFLIWLNREYKAGVLAYLVYAAAVFLLLSNKIISGIPGHSPAYYWLWFMVAVLLGLVPEAVKLFLARFSTSKGPKYIGSKKAVIAGIAIVLVCIAAFGSWMIYSQRSIETASGSRSTLSIVARAAESRNVQERVVFYQDALKVIKDHPLLGTGGQGWNSVYRQYQPYNYSTTLIHSHYLQVLVEAGVIGFAALMAFWYFFLSTAVKLIRGNSGEDRFLVWSIACTAMALGIHSIIDFNLSLPSVFIVLWGCWGMTAGINQFAQVKEPLKKSLKHEKPRAILYVMATGTSIVILLTFFSLLSIVYTDRGALACNKQSYEQAEQEFQTAARLNPLSSQNYAHLSSIYMIKGVDQSSPKDMEQSLNYIEKALQLERNNPQYRVLKGKALLNLDRIQEGVQEFETAHKLTPFVQAFAEQLQEIYFLVGQYYYAKGDGINAKIYLQKAVAFPASIEKRVNEMAPRYKNLQVDSSKLMISESIKKRQVEAEKLLAGIK